MKYGYARVSTIHQRKDGNSLEDQRNQLQQEGCDIIVEEQFTGARMDRPKFQRLCALLEEGDTLVVCKLDRFARTVVEGALTCRDVDAAGCAHPYPQHGCDRGHAGGTADPDHLPGLCRV